MTDRIRVDLETASREELVEEIGRLAAVVDNWAHSWRGIVQANTNAWISELQERDAKIATLESITEHHRGGS